MWWEVGRFILALWHVAGIVLVVVLVNEVGIDAWRRLSRRLRYRRPTRPEPAALADAHAEAEWTVAYFDEFRRAVRVDWKPYVEWWQRPFRGAYVTIDERGLRPTPGEHAADAGALRILCFGGSTMMGMGARDGHTIPALIARRLAELGLRAAVSNYGQLGHNLAQEVITLQELLKAGARVDLALFYDGVNEMACAAQTGRAGGLFNEARRRAEFNLLHADRRCDLVMTALLALVPRTLRRLRGWTGLALRGPVPAAEIDLSQIDLHHLARAVIAAYAANLRLVRMLATGFGFRALFFWQPVITTKQRKTADEERWERDYTSDPAARRALYAAIVSERRQSPELAAAAEAVDLSALFDERDDPLYIDLYHLSEAGNAAVAEAMLPHILAAAAAAR
jgi:lysophospholipase L1-like esterase